MSVVQGASPVDAEKEDFYTPTYLDVLLISTMVFFKGMCYEYMAFALFAKRKRPLYLLASKSISSISPEKN